MGLDGWQSVALGDVVKIKHGWPFKSELFSDELAGQPIVVNIGNFEYTGGFRFESTTLREYRGEYPKEYELAPQDVLLVMTCQTPGGEILGIPGRIPADQRIYLHNQRMGKVVVTRPDFVLLDFLYWVFLWKDFNQELVSTASGTKILHTSPGRIEAFKFDLPPLKEQEKIARILGALDDKIELNRRMNRTLEAMAAALFKSWFVDFDPVTRNAVGADGRPPLPGMNAETAALFPSAFQDSEIGPIPEGWMISTIGDMVTAVGGSTPSTTNPIYWEGGTLAWATPKDLANLSDPVLLKTERCITEAGLTQSRSGMLPPGTVLMSSRAPVGYLAITEIPVAINQGFIAMKCDKGVPNHYIFCWLHENMDTIIAHANGTTFLEISKANFRPIPALLPPEPIRECFAKMVDKWHAQTVINVQQSHTLARIRDALLPKLLSGEIRVKATEPRSVAEQAAV